MKVLVVEDDPSTQVLVRTVLQNLGYEVTHVSATALDALRAAEINPPDLLLVDVEIEGAMDGIETAEVFADRFSIPVVYMTTHADPVTLERAKLTSPSGYILKPVDEPRLSTALEMALMRHRMERELEEREVWIRTIVSCLAEGVIATDPAGRVRYLNPAAAELLACQVDRALGRPIAEVFRVTPGTPGQPLEDPITQVMRTGQAVTEHLTQVMADGRVRTVEASGRPIRGGVATLGAVLTFRDVAERMRADETMRRAAKMQAVGTLASGVAHHFNNALQIMLGHAELIASVVERTDPICQSAEAIRRTGRRSTELVKQLLAFSHTDRLMPDNLAVRELVDELVALIRTVLPAHIRFHPPVVVPETYIEVGRKELEQALLALVDNAKDSMPQGGELKLEVTRRTRAAGERGRVEAEVVFSIVDSGRGITPEVRTHLFEPFFTTKEPGQGTGLGLSSVFMAAQRHGGSVEVDSEPGRGATFRLVVPEAEPVGEKAKATLANPTSVTDRGAVQMACGDETVLLVEDEDDVRALIATALKNLGYTVLEAAGSDEALELAESHAGVIHLVLADLVMPGLNGYEVAARVEKARPGVRVLFMSAYDEEFTQVYLAPNATTPLHLKKPFRIETLAWKVRRAVTGG